MKKATWLLVLGLGVLSGCGIPIDTEPESLAIEVEAIPDEPGVQGGELSTATLYLVSGEKLVRVTRDLPDPAELDQVLESLFEGTTAPEERANLRSAVPPGTSLIDLLVDGDTVLIDLDPAFASVGGEEETLAVAQIVLTATGTEGVDKVAFRLEGVPTAVPVAGGALSTGPVTADDYATLVSP